MPDAEPLIILGPTAVGKSTLGVELALRWRGEIISLDSMQVYRGMDIGTAKPGPEERGVCPHHLIDCRDVTDGWDVAHYLDAVRTAQAEIVARGAVPVMVGGSAMYIKALMDGLCDGPTASEAVRQELQAEIREQGLAHLHHTQLTKVDPVSAARIHPNDERRIVRALEVYRLTGRPMSELQTQWAAPAATHNRMIGLTMPRERLYERIDARVRAMIDMGLVDEVRRLRMAGLEQNRSAAAAIGYAETIAHLDGEYDLARAVELIQRNTRRYAKHQLTWFRKDERIAWFDVARYADVAALADAVEAFVRNGGPTSAPPERL
jgi:tRNA dimethylallyltransferase